MEIRARKEIKQVLMLAKNQFIDIAVKNKSGKWSTDYYAIADIKAARYSDEKSIFIVLNSTKDSHCVMMNIDNIYGLKFNKYLNLDGKLTNEFKPLSKDAQLPVAL